MLALAAAAPALGATLTDDGLMMTTQVAAMRDGALIYPRGARYLAREIGCSDRDTMDDVVAADHPDGFLVSFEPLLDKYAAAPPASTAPQRKCSSRSATTTSEGSCCRSPSRRRTAGRSRST
ncbi:hypothetical protein KFE25_010338 [Diacronema lutheri]|uniref:Uncharacterized protein n=1 Tax=Diacronema lutheri TaxID=2081491 RepID=A0A8J5X9U0_DIALT|nr:hypothetical protein KFE25_010338 [Diacronema lutheri]